jgi:hypothetical protein
VIGGNSITNPTSQWIGTQNAEDFRIKTNGNDVMVATSGGQVGIGTTTPVAGSKLNVAGGDLILSRSTHPNPGNPNFPFFDGTEKIGIGTWGVLQDRNFGAGSQLSYDYQTELFHNAFIYDQANNLYQSYDHCGGSLRFTLGTNNPTLGNTNNPCRGFTFSSFGNATTGCSNANSSTWGESNWDVLMTIIAGDKGGNTGETQYGNVGIGTNNPKSKLHIYSDANILPQSFPATVRIQSTPLPPVPPATASFGYAKLELACNQIGDASEWRPCYIQSGQESNLNGAMRLFVNNGGNSGNSSKEKVRISNRGTLFAAGLYTSPAADDISPQLTRVAQNQVEIDDGTGPRKTASGLTLTDLAGWNLPQDAPLLPGSNHACLSVDPSGRVILQRECCYDPTMSGPPGSVPPEDWQNKIDKIDQQDREIQDLKDRISKLEAILLKSDNSNQMTGSQVNTASTVQFYQNDPNPFSTSTIISYLVPDGISNAVLVINSSDGKELVRLPLSSRAHQDAITVSASSLASGTYFYHVIADGAETAFKKMVVVK